MDVFIKSIQQNFSFICKMKHLLSFSVILLLLSSHVYGITPGDKSTIHATQVLFRFDAVNEAAGYVINIYDAGTSKMIHSQESQHPALICSKLLKFGKKYQWKISSFNKQRKLIKQSPLYEFNIVKSNRANKTVQKVDIAISDSSKFLDGLIIMDNNIIINRKGDVVFSVDSSFTVIRDFELTPQGTFTFLDSNIFMEMDMYKRIRWKSPIIKNDTIIIKDYHHDMYKTSYGTYLCMALVKYKNEKHHVKYSCLVEFDKQNKITWFWSEKDFYPNDTLKFKASHMNSLYFDEEENKIYVSNRDLNSIIRIDKATGLIDYSYGFNINDSVDYFINPHFKMQHRFVKLPNGNFLVFNNDSGENASQARTSVMEITNPEIGEADIVWEYKFNFQDEIENFVPRMGGASRLPNDNILIATGVFNKSFEITRDGEIVWLARCSQFNKKEEAAMPIYRNNYISSLYPYQFILYQMKSKSGNEVVLYNIGTEATTFEVKTTGLNQTENIIQIELKPGAFEKWNTHQIQKIHVRSLQSGESSSINLTSHK